MNEDEIGVEEMRCALSAIGNEIQRYNDGNSSLNESTKDDNTISELVKYKSLLNLKRDQIKLLRRNLKTACIVVKALSTAKARESDSVTNEISNIRSQYWDMVKQEREKKYLVCVLQAENQTLRDKLASYNNFIDLGYKETQHQQEENSEENINSLSRLRKIILCCGQYYANYQNVIVKCTQLEQKVRFLNSKLRIVENNLETTSNELKKYRGVNDVKLLAKRDNKSESQLCTNLDIECFNYEIRPRSSVTNLKMIKIELNKESVLESYRGLDLTSHFGTIKKLLNDQNTLIKYLKCLSNEINLETFRH